MMIARLCITDTIQSIYALSRKEYYVDLKNLLAYFLKDIGFIMNDSFSIFL